MVENDITTEEVPCTECDQRKKRDAILTMGLVEGACAVINDPETRSACHAMSDALTPEQLTDPKGAFKKFIQLTLDKNIKINDLLNAYGEGVNGIMAKSYQEAVEELIQEGTSLPQEVIDTYNAYRSKQAMG
jgi:hypothetical protein